ncbi:Wzz/FepE/Etk N-terminal domain-containing protein, partial [Fulvivirga lutimaris]|uniref:Wzz/FepE/Etk N-terminal domain-containing protein n=1 Tax=Fulvivirga lutimaris TaxID=1819566 RepID=UPI0012BCC087
DLLYLFKILIRRIWIIIVIPLIAGAIAFFITYNSDYTFKSTAQLSTSLTTKDDISLQDERFNFREVEIKFNNLMESLTSDQVVYLVSYRLLLHDLDSADSFKDVPVEERTSELWDSPERLLKAKSIIRTKLNNMEVLLNMNPEEKQLIKLLEDYGYDHGTLKESLNVRRIDYTDYILISAVSEKRLLSAYIVNTL